MLIRVAVMDNGKLVEFDSPAKLIQNETSHFASLVAEMRRMEKKHV